MDGAEKGKDRGSTENLNQPSALDKLTSGIEEGKQYSGADARKLVEDALSADGREQKDRAEKAEAQVAKLTVETSGLTTKYNTMSSQMSEFLRVQNEAEADKLKDDPVVLGSLRARQANAAESLRLQGVGAGYEAKNTKLTERETDIAQKEASVNIKLAALTAGVDEAELADLVPDGNPARLKKAADILKKRGPADEQLRKPPGLGLRPASAISAGGGLSGLTPDEKIQRGLDSKKK